MHRVAANSLRPGRANGKATSWDGKCLFSLVAVRRPLPLGWRSVISLRGLLLGASEQIEGIVRGFCLGFWEDFIGEEA